LNMEGTNKNQCRRPLRTVFLFPAFVMAIYGMAFAIAPDRALQALTKSGNVFLTIAQPLAVVFVVMLVLNVFVKPVRISRFVGKGAGIKGMMLSVVAGIISMGPIYAWYPLLKKLREEGAGNAPIAIFLYNRAVKPFLLPVMIAYFGWAYVVILTLFTILASMAVGYSMSLITGES
jgi:uncharacterized membrane protein YraQ (UPF0718 family)